LQFPGPVETSGKYREKDFAASKLRFAEENHTGKKTRRGGVPCEQESGGEVWESVAGSHACWEARDVWVGTHTQKVGKSMKKKVPGAGGMKGGGCPGVPPG